MTTRTPGLFLTALLVAAISVMLGGCNGTTSLPGPSFAPSPQSQTAATFWVSPVGNDAAEGTFSAPFQTLERARQAVRTVTPNPGQDIVVNLRGGTYRMGGSFILTPEDSGRNGGDVVYRAAPGEHPVLSGATRVENWSLADASLNIYRAYVGDRLARQLYVNGKRGIRARTEDVPSGFLPAYVYVPGGNGHGEPEPISPNGIEFIPTALNPARWSDPSTWTNVTDIESVCVTQWKMMRVPLASVTPYIPLVQTGLIVMQEPAWFNANLFLIEYLLVPGPWSMWQATWFENAYEFLDEPGEFYLNRSSGYLYYIPRAGENLATADVELPSIEVLVDGLGDVDRPIKNLRFEGLTFTGATWLGPSSANGYVCDQSGFFLTGYGHQPNVIGHNPNDERTLGNVKFRYAHNIKIIGNIFEHLGGAALDFDTGCQNNTISDNLFEDIASTGIVLGGISPIDAHPVRPEQVVRDNTITNNNLRETGRDYVDTAAIYLGFTTRTLVSHNSIYDCPWSGIAIGWGWGLLDVGMFPGVDGATRGMWGTYNTPTPNSGNVIRNNRIDTFMQVTWDAGAVYTLGQQGTSTSDPLRIIGNVASNKLVTGGGNTFYTDGGSRYIVLENNASVNNPQGFMDFGPPSKPDDPLPYFPYTKLNGQVYGDEFGGCRTFGDIVYIGNWVRKTDFCTPTSCEFSEGGVSYPTRLTFSQNHIISGHASEVPRAILDGAGASEKAPDTIPQARWILPPPL